MSVTNLIWCVGDLIVDTINDGKPKDFCIYEGWNFNSGNYLFTTDTK